MFWYHFLDYFFLIFHTAITIFNVFGWIWRKTRLANFITLALTALSWFGLGLFYGIGFCPLTEWHWQVLEKLGQHNLPYSYITYIIHRLVGLDVNARLVEISTAVVFFLALFVSGYLNFFKKAQFREHSRTLPPLNNIISNHRTIVSNHRGIVLNHRAIVSNHRGIVSNHRAIVSNHRGIVLNHRGIVSNHRGIVLNHRAIVSNHRAIVSNHRAIVSNHRTIV